MFQKLEAQDFIVSQEEIDFLVEKHKEADIYCLQLVFFEQSSVTHLVSLFLKQLNRLKISFSLTSIERGTAEDMLARPSALFNSRDLEIDGSEETEN